MILHLESSRDCERGRPHEARLVRLVIKGDAASRGFSQDTAPPGTQPPGCEEATPVPGGLTKASSPQPDQPPAFKSSTQRPRRHGAETSCPSWTGLNRHTQNKKELSVVSAMQPQQQKQTIEVEVPAQSTLT